MVFLPNREKSLKPEYITGSDPTGTFLPDNVCVGPYDLSDPLSESLKEGELFQLRRFPLVWCECGVGKDRRVPNRTRGDALSAVPPSVFVIVVTVTTVVVRARIVPWKEKKGTLQITLTFSLAHWLC